MGQVTEGYHQVVVTLALIILPSGQFPVDSLQFPFQAANFPERLIGFFKHGIPVLELQVLFEIPN